VLHHESLAAAATEKSLAAAKVEHEVQLMEMQLQLQQQAEQVEELQEELEQVGNCSVVEVQLNSSRHAACAVCDEQQHIFSLRLPEYCFHDA
jgi:cytochrome c peroxidase